MKAWKANDNIDFNFYNAHDLNNLVDTSSEESIKRKLRERHKNAKLFVVLVGEKTKNHRKFVRWEMEQALKLGLPIVAVNLNKINGIDKDLCPAIIRDELVLHIPFKQSVKTRAIDNWPDEFKSLKAKGKSGPYHY